MPTSQLFNECLPGCESLPEGGHLRLCGDGVRSGVKTFDPGFVSGSLQALCLIELYLR